MNEDILKKHITNFWDTEITPTLIDYIKIPNKSPSFDPDWEEHGHMEKVLKLAVAWTCLLYTSDAADDSLRVDLGGRRIIKKSDLY